MHFRIALNSYLGPREPSDPEGSPILLIRTPEILPRTLNLDQALAILDDWALGHSTIIPGDSRPAVICPELAAFRMPRGNWRSFSGQHLGSDEQLAHRILELEAASDSSLPLVIPP